MEIEANMEVEDSLLRQSTPFVSVFVKSVDDAPCEGALLTLWNPNEQQESLLKEGTIVQFRNLDLKATKHEGVLQLLAREATPMRAVVSPTDMTARIGYTPRSLVPLYHLHVVSKSLSLGKSLPFERRVFDVVGAVLKVTQEGDHHHKIYVTDESGLLLRIDRNGRLESSYILTSVGDKPLENAQHALPMEFRDLHMMPYDSVENCAVAMFTHNSSFGSRNCSRISELEAAQGDPLLSCATIALQAGTSMLAINGSRGTSIVVAIGRIVGCKSIPNETSCFAIEVDCGQILQTFVFPSFLLDEILLLIGEKPQAVTVQPQKEKRYEFSKLLQKLFKAKPLLLRFVLQRKEKEHCYEVRQVSAVDGNALATLHSAIHKLREPSL